MSPLNLDRLAFDLEKFRAERGWYNLNLPPEQIRALLADTTWYELQIPEEELRLGSIDRVREWQQIALAPLEKYTERYYTYRKREWEMPHLEYRDLAADDPNFLGVRENPGESYYRILYDRSQEEIAAKLKELKNILESGKLRPWEFRGLKAIWFERHLYQPLLFLDQDTVEISPVPLNPGEKEFVADLRDYHDSSPSLLVGHEIYLLRNLSRGRGVGFFEAGNFYPDFLLWLLSPSAQNILFIDPKGIRNLPPSDPKIQFHTTIREIETRLADPRVHLHSFILSNTPSHTMSALWQTDKVSMSGRNILFPSEDRDHYIALMLSQALASGSSAPPTSAPPR